jgi:quercetin dioxygenase-like cupin family protein
MSEQAITSKRVTPIPPDDPKRNLAIARPNTDQSLPHIGFVGDTYTILLSGDDTGGRYCLIDMHIPPGGGPPPHRHDFEESFSILEGEIEATFRGEKSAVRAGETINIPANAPHSFTNASKQTVRLLCLCVPPGQENSSRRSVSLWRRRSEEFTAAEANGLWRSWRNTFASGETDKLQAAFEKGVTFLPLSLPDQSSS